MISSWKRENKNTTAWLEMVMHGITLYVRSTNTVYKLFIKFFDIILYWLNFFVYTCILFVDFVNGFLYLVYTVQFDMKYMYSSS